MELPPITGDIYMAYDLYPEQGGVNIGGPKGLISSKTTDDLRTDVTSLQVASFWHEPMGLSRPASTTNTNLESGTTYFLYLGRIPAPITSATIVYRLTTAYVVGADPDPYAEFGLFWGTMGYGLAPGALHRIKVDDVSADSGFTTSPPITTVYTLYGDGFSSVAAGSGIWLAMGFRTSGSNAVMPTFEAYNPDIIGLGNALQISGQPSTIGTNGRVTDTVIVTSSINLPVVFVYLS